MIVKEGHLFMDEGALASDLLQRSNRLLTYPHRLTLKIVFFVEVLVHLMGDLF